MGTPSVVRYLEAYLMSAFFGLHLQLGSDGYQGAALASKFNGLGSNIDGLGRKPYDNNTLWINLFFAF